MERLIFCMVFRCVRVCVCVYAFCGVMNMLLCRTNDCSFVFIYLDKLVLRPFRQPNDVAFLACCVRRIIQRSNCSSSISFIIWRSRKSGLSNK